jgi:hypothetical protein
LFSPGSWSFFLFFIDPLILLRAQRWAACFSPFALAGAPESEAVPNGPFVDIHLIDIHFAEHTIVKRFFL